MDAPGSRICARCHEEYDARYDGCPHCAERAISKRLGRTAAGVGDTVSGVASSAQESVRNAGPLARRRTRAAVLAVCAVALVAAVAVGYPKALDYYRRYSAERGLDTMMREWREDYPSTGESSSGGIFLDEATWELQPITLDEYLANGRDFSIFRNISDEQYESIVQDWHERDLDPATRAYYFRVTVRNAIPWDELETRRDYRFDTMVFKEVDGERAGEWSQMTLDGEPLSE